MTTLVANGFYLLRGRSTGSETVTLCDCGNICVDRLASNSEIACLSASASRVLGSKMCATCPGSLSYSCYPQPPDAEIFQKLNRVWVVTAFVSQEAQVWWECTCGCQSDPKAAHLLLPLACSCVTCLAWPRRLCRYW